MIDIDNVPREELAKFLDELTALSKKYKILIGGCGCCNSPYLQTPEGINNFDIDNFRYTYDDTQTGWTRTSALEFME